MRKTFFVFLVFLLISNAFNVQGNDLIKFPDNVVYATNVLVNDDQFVFFDKGNRSIKIFSSNLKNFVNAISIKDGQGPGEVSPLSCQNECKFVILRNKIFVNDTFKRRVVVFNVKGQFIRELKFGKSVFALLPNKGELFVFLRDWKEKPPYLFCKAIDPSSFKIKKTFYVNERLVKMERIKQFSTWTDPLIGMYDDKLIVLLDNGTVFFFNKDGKIIKKIKLSFKPVCKKVLKDNTLNIDIISYYSSLIMSKKSSYTIFVYRKNDKYLSNLLKIANNSVRIIKKLQGVWKIAGISLNNLYIFNKENQLFKIISLK